MRSLLIHNPGAGSGTHTKSWLVSTLRRAGLSVSYRSTKEEGIKGRWGKAELVIAAGGDGTVARVIAELEDRSVPVAIIPLGVANNIARSLGVAETEAALAAILEPGRRTQAIRIGRCKGPWGERRFVESVGVGPLAQVIGRKPADNGNRADGLLDGRRALQKHLRAAEPLEIAVTVDGKRLPDDILGLEVINIAYTGPALPLAPDTDPGDDKLDVFCMTADGREPMIAWLDSPAKGSPPVQRYEGRKIVIAGRLPHQRVDDKVFDPTDEKATIMVELEPHAAKILIPPSGLSAAAED
jgi:diacylglycerol kinase family enzyme